MPVTPVQAAYTWWRWAERELLYIIAICEPESQQMRNEVRVCSCRKVRDRAEALQLARRYLASRDLGGDQGHSSPTC